MTTPKFSEIQRLGEDKVAGLPPLNVAVLRNIVLDPIAPYLRWFAWQEGFRATRRFGEYDNVVQEAVGGGSDAWYGVALVGRYPLSARVAINGRVERYSDPDRVIVASLGAGGFETSGASLGIDVTTAGGVLWRTEVRGFRGDRPLYPNHAGGLDQTNAFMVTSLALSL